MKNKTIYATLIALVIAITAFTGCKKDTQTSGTTKVEIRMTDAPGDFDAINLNVKQVILVSGGKPYTFEVDHGIFNILDFRIGTSSPDILVASGDMPSGEINEIRLVLYDNNTIVVDGKVQDLKTPSAQSSGWKVKLTENPELVPGVTYTLLLDFDAAKSIVATGNGKYILKPVVRGITAATSGLISGTVLPIGSHPEVLVINGTDTVGTVTDMITGKFTVGGLATGNYTVKILPVEGFAETTIPNVAVTVGQNTSIGIVTLQ
ncbi:hypothetical protein CPT03_04520 [Pedobacter ginsengisoli]|uniref:DUF4382 domain-containing protein n=1 Tax=Pedobacter ginsengisoli TaxID=363852 RepID=A0A2D1U2G1_9SPHI|nr:DUF4382 domain-containing protein [Pedobacter ginsengisoli]ATP55781.1 hypothetical protein CPT03_04520 [Pedobacter ginsengisoli]